jgi:hypothetical protein
VLSVRCAAFGEPTAARSAPSDLVRLAIGLSVDSATGRDPLRAVEERLRRLADRLAQALEPGRPVKVDVGRAARPARLTARTKSCNGKGSGGDPDGSGRDSPQARRSPLAGLLSGLRPSPPAGRDRRRLHDATAETVDALGTALEELTGPVLVLLLGRP